MASKSGEAELNIVKQFHDGAFVEVEQALSLEESERSLEALAAYEKGLRLLEQGLSVGSPQMQLMGENWDTVRVLQMKMRKTREHVLSRLEHLSKERGGTACPSYELPAADMPPSYEEACSAPSSPQPTNLQQPLPSTSGVKNGQCKSYGEVASMLQPMDIDNTVCREMPANATEIFSIANGVQIFFISSTGIVSAPSYPTALRMYRTNNGGTTGPHRVKGYLMVDQWTFPLHPGLMPIVHTYYGAYVLPDTTSDQPGSAVGILLSDDIPVGVRDTFEHLICEMAAVRNEANATASSADARLSTRISDGIAIGAEYVSRGVLYGAEVSSEYVRLAAKKLREKMSPPSSPAQVDPRVQQGFQLARDVSDVALRVSGYLLGLLGKATMAVGQQLAPHVRAHGAHLISKAVGEDEPDKGEATMDGIMEVASGGLKGFSTVYRGLECAASILAKSLISETVQTVNHRYGGEASRATDNTLNTVGNVALTAHNMHNMGLKAIVKNTAKDTGKALVQDYKKPDPNDDHHHGQPTNGKTNKKEPQ